MSFRDLIQYCKAKSIADALQPDELAIWRSACRSYSEYFNTPLKEVEKLDPEHVFLSTFEKQLDDIDVEKNVEQLLEQLYRIKDPDYDSKEEKNLEDFIKNVEKKAKEEEKKKSLLEKEKKEEKKQPSGGSVDFSNLPDEE